MNKVVQHSTLKGIITVPPSKSDSQRAILAAALASGVSHLINVGDSDDERAMLNSVRQIGGIVTHSEKSIAIEGSKAFPGTTKFTAGESGLGFRLLTSICATHAGEHTISGEGSLRTRPQDFFERHLKALGCEIRSENGLPPLTIVKAMHAGEITIDGSLSSQFLSGLLMAMPLLDGDSRIRVLNLKSSPYVQMTLNTLTSFGIQINNQQFEVFDIPGNQKYQACTYTIEGDWSAASYWFVAAALGHSILIEGLQTNSDQADKRILKALENANCIVKYIDDHYSVDGSSKIAFEFDASDCPDLFPALVTLAAFCDGTSVITGVERLKHKESDRALALQQEFGKLGCLIELRGNKMIIQGGSPLHATTLNSHEDHRIAMCLAIACININGQSTIEGSEAVSKSYPAFWEDLERIQ